MDHFMKPTPIVRKFFTPIVILVACIAVVGIVFVLARLIFGIGAVTNLSNQFPWGIWIGIDVAAGVALAAGGFTTPHRTYNAQRRISCYCTPGTFNGNTRVYLCSNERSNRSWTLLFYLAPAYYVERELCSIRSWHLRNDLFVCFIHRVFTDCNRKIIGRVNLPGFLKRFNNPVDKLLRILDKALDKTMFIFIIAGVVLSCLHQSSLGTLMVIAGPKIHPLWQTPVAPLLFLLSAISVGFPMVIFESLITSKSFGLKPETHILSNLARMVAPILGIYLAFKIGDMVIRQSFVHLNEFSVPAVMFTIELVLGIIVPLRIFMSPKLVKSPAGLFIGAALVIFGVLLNRINTFITAYTPPYQMTTYFPSIGEIMVTLGFISLEILLFRVAVMIFPIVSVPQPNALKTKFRVRGVQ
jgi:Ni/Fe-hydrogenase subunit HybB-like protein